MSVQSVMTADASGAELVTFARQVAERLKKDDLHRTQIRNIFTEVRQIEAMWGRDESAMRRLNMLKAKLAYQTARTRSVKYLKDVLSEAIDLVEKAPKEKKDEQFQRFVDFFEAILAFHRAVGGRD